MCGKIVAGTIYIHKSAVDELPLELFNKYHSHHTQLLHSIHKDFEYDIIAVSASDVQFIACRDWDIDSEPVVGDRINVWKKISEAVPNGEWLTDYRKGDVNNPRIFHHRNLFVKEDYTEFDYEEDCFRSEQIRQCIEKEMLSGVSKRDITNRMGRQDWWSKFCDKHGL